MCTKLPNWGAEYNLQVGDSGYVTMQTYHSGEFYYDRVTNIQKKVKFTNVYFKDFIKDMETTKKIRL